MERQNQTIVTKDFKQICTPSHASLVIYENTNAVFTAVPPKAVLSAGS